ncbi:hypothetical protein Hanom_Chr07g00630051 [Helianthus anomalus]
MNRWTSLPHRGVGCGIIPRWFCLTADDVAMFIWFRNQLLIGVICVLESGAFLRG